MVGALTLAGGIRTDANGQPVRRFSKDLIRAGDWFKDSTGQAFTIDAKWMEGRVAEFERMKAAGVRVPVPVGHTNDPESNRGYVEEMWVDGDVLRASIDLIGEKAIALASTVEVSIYVPAKLVDGKGNEYIEPIEHVALVTDPVICGQETFVPIAASRGGTTVNVPVYRLSREGDSMDWKELCKALGLSTDGLDDQTGPAAVMAKIGEMSKAKETAETAMAAARKGEADAKAALAASRQKVEPDAVLVRMAAENRDLKLSRLVDAGKITPAVRTKLADIYIGKDNAGLKLSLDSVGDGQFAAVCDALCEMDTRVLAAQTLSQSVALGRHVPGSGSTMTPEDVTKQARADAEERNKALGRR